MLITPESVRVHDSYHIYHTHADVTDVRLMSTVKLLYFLYLFVEKHLYKLSYLRHLNKLVHVNSGTYEAHWRDDAEGFNLKKKSKYASVIWTADNLKMNMSRFGTRRVMDLKLIDGEFFFMSIVLINICNMYSDKTYMFQH